MSTGNNKTVPTAMVELKITVHKAENLAAKDLFLGFIPLGSDPYIEVRLMPQGKCNVGHYSVQYLGKTEVMKWTTNPVWENLEVFSAKLPASELGSNAIFHLNLMDFDEDSKDDPMGIATVPIEVKKENSVLKEKWYKVKAAGGEDAQGRIQCTVKITHSMQDMPEGGVLANKQQQHCYDVQLKVIQAKDLAAKDLVFFGLLGASSDPYVIVKLNGAQAMSGKKQLILGTTEYREQTVHPRWNEVFASRVPIDELDPKQAAFELTIMDRDDSTTDDLMGVVTIPIQDIVKKVTPQNLKAKIAPTWYDVPANSANGEEATGQVQCSVAVSFVQSGSLK